MKRIGILFGQEQTFPPALVHQINSMNHPDVRAEYVQLGGILLDTLPPYDLIIDRISHEVPFYRAYLKMAVAAGTIVVNNPFWWSADDKFFNNVLAQKVGVAVPKTVILPSHTHPPNTSAESMRNLIYPLNWEEIFSYIGFPAYFKPHSGGGWKSVYQVENPQAFFDAYRDSGDLCMTLQEEIKFEEYYRCYAIGQKYVHIMPYEPRNPHHLRYVTEKREIAPALRERIVSDCLKLTGILGYDFDTLEFAVRDGIPYAIDYLNPAPDCDFYSVTPENFTWVVEHAAKWAVERVLEGPRPAVEYRWDYFLRGEMAAPQSNPAPGAGSTPPAAAPSSAPSGAAPAKNSATASGSSAKATAAANGTAAKLAAVVADSAPKAQAKAAAKETKKTAAPKSRAKLKDFDLG